MDIREAIEKYLPCCEQEARDKAVILSFIDSAPDAFERSNLIAHMTVSAWVVNPARDKVLMVYHKIYDSWSWTGGHADGQADLLAAAMREAREETGIREVEPLSPAIQSLDILPVWGHEKQGRYVTAHLHLSVGYALTAPENQLLAAKTDENSGVRWVSVRQLEQYVTEPYMLYIYRKIGARLGAF